MQDNLHDDLFTDHAWQEMHKILDREMPERKRRGFLFWLLPALGLCLLTAQDSLMGNNIPVDSKNALGNKPAIAVRKADEQTKPDKSAKAKPRQDIPLVQNQTTPVVQDNQTPVQPGIAARPVKEFGLKAAAATESTKPTDLSGREDHAQAVNRTTPENPLNSFTAKLPVASEPLPDQLESTSKPGLDDSQPLSEKWNTLDLVPTAHFELNQPDSKQETPELTFQKRLPKLEWWAETGTQITNGVQGLSGYRVGILTGIPLGQFRLRVGTGFTKTEVDFKSVKLDSTGQTRSMDVQFNNQNSAFLGAKGSSTNQTVSSINLQLIDLNVSLYHQLGKRFGAALGGSVQYVQGIQLGDQYLKGSLFESANQDNASPVTSQNGGSTSTPIKPESSTLTKASFHNLGIALQGEVSYQLAPRWSTSLGYRYSTRGFTKSSDLVLKPNWLELGVRFRVK